jgi:hypothetical protein
MVLMRLLIPLLLVLAAAPSAPAAQVISARAGRVSRVEGDVLQHCHQKKESLSPLKTGQVLHDGDAVVTSGGGQAVLALDPGSYLRVTGDAFLSLRETAFDRMHFDVDRGEVCVESKSLGKKAALVLHAPPGQLAVTKPGHYHVRVGPGGETEALVLEGEIRYTDGGGGVASVRSRGSVRFVRKGGADPDSHPPPGGRH